MASDEIRARLAALETEREAISELFPDDATHKHEQTGESLYDNIQDVLRELAREKALREEWKAATAIAANLAGETKKELLAALRTNEALEKLTEDTRKECLANLTAYSTCKAQLDQALFALRDRRKRIVELEAGLREARAWIADEPPIATVGEVLPMIDALIDPAKGGAK